jgi:hypothetical protein
LKIIEIVISPTGQSRVETKGFQGSACRDASRFLEVAIGARVAEQQTAEFYSADNTATQAAHISPSS